MTLAHALAVVSSVLGQRLQIGMATFASGVVHVVLAFALGWKLGILGIILAGVVSHGLVFPAMAWRPFGVATRMPETALVGEVIVPWLRRMVPLALLSLGVQMLLGTPPLPVSIALGAFVGLFAVWYMRPLYLSFGPVRALYDRLFKWLPRAAPGAGAA